MDMGVQMKGLDDALKAMEAAFPKDPNKQRGLLNSAMRGAANKTIVPVAKQLAKAGDGSGALSEAIAVRNQSKKKLRSKNVAAGVEVVPVRFNRKAIALYIQHYYTNVGRVAPANMFASGIRHGHLVEFGSVNNSPRPFLKPAGDVADDVYIQAFAKAMRSATERAVKRAAKK